MSNVDGLLNARDLGGHRCAGWVTRPGVVFRSARMDRVTQRDVEGLRNTLTTIVDCRNAIERQSIPSLTRSLELLDSYFPPLFCPPGAPRPQLGSPARLLLPFRAANAGMIRHALRELPCARLALRFACLELWRRMLAAMPFSWLGTRKLWEQRQRQVRLASLGAVLRDTGGYAQLYYMFATTAREQLCWALQVCSTPEAQPCLVHCHSGKDRTGLVAALLLEAVGVARQDVLDDFEASHSFAVCATRSVAGPLTFLLDLDLTRERCRRRWKRQRQTQKLGIATLFWVRYHGGVRILRATRCSMHCLERGDLAWLNCWTGWSLSLAQLQTTWTGLVSMPPGEAS
jgi:hypothetical protein